MELNINKDEAQLINCALIKERDELLAKLKEEEAK